MPNFNKNYLVRQNNWFKWLVDDGNHEMSSVASFFRFPYAKKNTGNLSLGTAKNQRFSQLGSKFLRAIHFYTCLSIILRSQQF